MKLIEQCTDWYMDGWEAIKRVYTMQAYAIHLATANTLLCKQLTVGTIKAYGTAAAQFVMARIHRDPRQWEWQTGNQFAKEYNMVLEEQKCWASVPKQCKPLTVAMWQYLFNKYCTGAYPKTSYQYQVTMWCGVGLHAGCRLSEYAQDSSHKTLGRHQTVRGSQEVRAFTFSDITFLTARRAKIPTRTAIRNRSRIGRIQLTWRYQKNGDNGQRKTFTRGKTIDMANCLADIIENFLKLCPRAPQNIPVGVYKDTVGHVSYIHDALINDLLQEAAIEVYNLDPIQDKVFISCFTSHSIRVGSCCILFANGSPPMVIKHTLRWRSDTFMIYLRDLDCICAQQTDAIDNQADAPCYI
jgi:hypothetical protein